MKIIINADDFGISSDVNAAILLLHQKGIVTSASIMANGSSFQQAVEISGNNPGLSVGVHLCLSGSFNMANNYKTLINHDTMHFFNIKDIYSHRLYRSFDPFEIFREYCLQIEKVLDHGINITHLDHHHHLHLYWPILREVIKAAKKYHLRFIRSQKILIPTKHGVVGDTYRRLHQLYLKSKLHTHSGYFEPNVLSKTDEDNFFYRFSRLLSIRAGSCEIVLHPHLANDTETSLFSDERLLQILKLHEIINYSNLMNDHKIVQVN